MAQDTEVRKLHPDMHGPDYFGVLPEQELIRLGYVWSFAVYKDGLCVRTGMSKIKDEPKLREYLASGLNRLEWEAIHGTN